MPIARSILWGRRGAAYTLAQEPESTIIPADQRIDWTMAGVDGGIPNRTTIDSTISTGGDDSTANETALQNAINAAASGEVVFVNAGMYRTGGLAMKSGVTLRGDGPWCKSTSSITVGTGSKVFTVPAGLTYAAGVVVRVWRPLDPGVFMQGSVTSYSGTSLDLNVATTGGSGTYADWRVSITVLKMTDAEAAVLQFGSGDLPFTTAGTFRTISSGATAGSTQIVVNSNSGITVGGLMVITETNDSSFVSKTSTNGTANWVDGWDTNGDRARGQIVEVTAINGTTITFEPALFTAYSNTPWATPYTPAIDAAGAEDLMVFATNSGSSGNFVFKQAKNCWIKNCYFDFADGDHGNIDWSYRCEIRHCHFYDGFVHTSGSFDGQVGLRYKSTLCRIEDNILERMHVGVMAEWGAAGNVIAYNYVLGGYDQGASSGNRWLTVCINSNHGAHPQFNLFEGNIADKFQADSYWGTSSHVTILRNYFSGFRTARNPVDTRAVSTTTWDFGQANIACDVWEGQSKHSIVGNILGNNGNWSSRSPQRKDTNANVGYDNPPICIVYFKGAENGSAGTVLANPSGTAIDHGNWDSVNDAIVWDSGIADHNMPDSYAYAAKPSWMGSSVAWPPIDSENVPADLADLMIPAKYRYTNGSDPS